MTTQGPVRVLVVDDDAVIRQLIALNLELEGYQVFMAGDGVEAIEQAALVRPHVVTLDVMMPRMDGLAAAEKLRADPATAGIKVCVVSARAQEADRRRAATAPGVDAYLAKPFDPQELIDMVGGLAGRSAG